jgi:hypothetical protein
MRLVWQWIELERALPPSWTDVRLRLSVEERHADQAAAMLGGANPLRHGSSVLLFVSRTGGVGPEALRRALLRLDRRGIGGTLEIVGATEAEQVPSAQPSSLAGQWDAAVGSLPDDWSDLYAELRLRSSDQLERAALLLAPTNPTRPDEALALRFRVAHRFGYGVSGRMARRCLERLDEERIPGEVSVLQVLCDTDAVGSQGPVWRIGRKAV